jgi:hypothetical protein
MGRCAHRPEKVMHLSRAAHLPAPLNFNVHSGAMRDSFFLVVGPRLCNIEIGGSRGARKTKEELHYFCRGVFAINPQGDVSFPFSRPSSNASMWRFAHDSLADPRGDALFPLTYSYPDPLTCWPNCLLAHRLSGRLTYRLSFQLTGRYNDVQV